MQISLQDCGCIAIPEELIVALKLKTGTVFELSWIESSRTISLGVQGSDTAGSQAVRLGAICRPGRGAE